MLSVLIIILFSLAISTAFKLLGSALFGTTPKGTASSFGLSGMIVAPLVVWRTSIAQDQTKSAKEALFNDKVKASITDLHTQLQITKWQNGKAANGWDDDVTRRNGAIDQLLGLATEDPQSASRIARMLSVSVKELSRAIQAKAIPDTSFPKEIRDWALSLKAGRSDVENAV